MGCLNKSERIKLVEWYIESRSVRYTQRSFVSSYGKKAPTYKSIMRLVDKFREDGNVADRKRSGRPRSARSAEKIAIVKDIITATPTKSLTSVAVEAGIKSKSSVHGIMRNLKLKAFKATVVQHLTELDVERRKSFSTSMINIINRNPDYLNNVLFSDESIFYLDKSVSAYNSYIWSEENPHHYVEKRLNPERLLVWCGLSARGIVGPYFFEGTINADAYLTMMRTYVVPRLRRTGLIDTVIFQQDGAAPHTAHRVLDYLEHRFPDRLISLRTGFTWPPRSPDLNPLDFYLWGHLKHVISGQVIECKDDLRQAIVRGIRTINRDANLTRRVIDCFRQRLHHCFDVDGRHFEHSL